MRLLNPSRAPHLPTLGASPKTHGMLPYSQTIVRAQSVALPSLPLSSTLSPSIYLWERFMRDNFLLLLKTFPAVLAVSFPDTLGKALVGGELDQFLGGPQ